ncbi:hypothetical protein CGLO_07182 [Colletotrichum gloeosporioides Cg-14]|uniref:Uncharacterized protein n=1 Tax=Colletotrichum gloeosporioides (strain Cg-14) TaxID=1237896 RepID=T0LN50_COLGC|nr:hypothetical protein CGLO_07182 [Colletotrichum gloeosporioides Cg-14]
MNQSVYTIRVDRQHGLKKEEIQKDMKGVM